MGQMGHEKLMRGTRARARTYRRYRFYLPHLPHYFRSPSGSVQGGGATRFTDIPSKPRFPWAPGVCFMGQHPSRQSV